MVETSHHSQGGTDKTATEGGCPAVVWLTLERLEGMRGSHLGDHGFCMYSCNAQFPNTEEVAGTQTPLVNAESTCSLYQHQITLHKQESTTMLVVSVYGHFFPGQAQAPNMPSVYLYGEAHISLKDMDSSSCRMRGRWAILHAATRQTWDRLSVRLPAERFGAELGQGVAPRLIERKSMYLSQGDEYKGTNKGVWESGLRDTSYAFEHMTAYQQHERRRASSPAHSLRQEPTDYRHTPVYMQPLPRTPTRSMLSHSESLRSLTPSAAPRRSAPEVTRVVKRLNSQYTSSFLSSVRPETVQKMTASTPTVKEELQRRFERERSRDEKRLDTPIKQHESFLKSLRSSDTTETHSNNKRHDQPRNGRYYYRRASTKGGDRKSRDLSKSTDSVRRLNESATSTKPRRASADKSPLSRAHRAPSPSLPSLFVLGPSGQQDKTTHGQEGDERTVDGSSACERPGEASDKQHVELTLQLDDVQSVAQLLRKLNEGIGIGRFSAPGREPRRASNRGKTHTNGSNQSKQSASRKQIQARQAGCDILSQKQAASGRTRQK
ncbi:unnamed protein product [Vitrella brassicaformis CCMP3155]|uniref:Uncharacterized protein n=2 Tax=Vitrella brassicaformis TaxID=1169539 RepID=A0A0G4EA06_VITBC|nr:unnamed protein product [Vitrella brassicaformis CCMP3155]|eukprot:CEL92031.1 unnamed protein product [Vitrella brassicaformis CCMP3155]